MACIEVRPAEVRPQFAAITRTALTLLLAATLAACQHLPSLGRADREPAAPPAEPGAEAPAEAPLELIPDPYTANARTVPAEARAAFDAARRELTAGRNAAAAEQFAALTQRHPELSGPWVNLGLARWRLNQLDAAATAFERAVAANAANGDAYTQWGVLERERGNFAKAEQLYREALRVWPHNYTAHLNLGVLLDLYMGRLDEALQHYKMAARIAGEPSRELQGWIVDLERRLNAG